MTPKQFKETCTGLGMSKKQINFVLKAIKRKSTWNLDMVDFVQIKEKSVWLCHETHNIFDQIDILEVRF